MKLPYPLIVSRYISLDRLDEGRQVDRNACTSQVIFEQIARMNKVRGLKFTGTAEELRVRTNVMGNKPEDFIGSASPEETYLAAMDLGWIVSWRPVRKEQDLWIGLLTGGYPIATYAGSHMIGVDEFDGRIFRGWNPLKGTRIPLLRTWEKISKGYICGI